MYTPTNAFWNFSGTNAGYGSGLIANGSGFGNPNAPDGIQAAFVQSNGVISQVLSGFIPGTNYTLTFYAAERSGNAQTWNVTIDGAVIASYNPGSGATSYATYTATFTATAATETLAFVGTDLAGGDNTIFIDDVQIVKGTFVNAPNFGFESPSVNNYQYNPAGGDPGPSAARVQTVQASLPMAAVLGTPMPRKVSRRRLSRSMELLHRTFPV